MVDLEIIKRAEDLSRRCIKTWDVTNTAFLTPAQRVLLSTELHLDRRIQMIFYGGYEDCERTAAFFIPEEQYDEKTIPEAVQQTIRAVRFRAYFGAPGHRDYLGAILASGVARDRLGDILISETEATIFCLPGILQHLLTINRIGRISVRAEELPFDAIMISKPTREEKTVSVMSMRLDAVTAGIFNLSRSVCTRLILEGNLSLNYTVCMKPDTPIHEGDTISLRGHGKAAIRELGGTSRKGRQFVHIEIYI